MSEQLYSLKRGALSKLAAELDASGRITAEKVAEILNESNVPAQAATFADDDVSDEEQREEALYASWRAMSGIAAPTVSPEEQAARAEFDAELAEVNAEMEAERQRRLAAERVADAEGDELYERAWKPWL